MRKSKFVFILCVFVFVLFICSLSVFLFDVNSPKYLACFIISLIGFVLIVLCYILLKYYEKKELKNYKFESLEFLVMDRDYYQNLRTLLDESEMENTSEEAKKLKKYEEIAIKYEKQRNVYIVFDDNIAVALVEVIKDLKNKTIYFDIIVGEENELKEAFVFISTKEGLQVMD